MPPPLKEQNRLDSIWCLEEKDTVYSNLPRRLGTEDFALTYAFGGGRFCSASPLMALAVCCSSPWKLQKPWICHSPQSRLFQELMARLQWILSLSGCQNPLDLPSPVPWWDTKAPLWSWEAQFSGPGSPWHAGLWAFAQSLVPVPCLSSSWPLSFDAPLSSPSLSSPLKLFPLVQDASTVHYPHSSDHVLELIYMSVWLGHVPQTFGQILIWMFASRN